MHDAIKSALPRLMQLEIDLLALPSRPLEREKSAASMSAALTQANQQIIEVTRYIEEISEKFAREQYDLLKIDDMNTDIKIQIGAAGDSSLMDWIIILLKAAESCSNNNGTLFGLACLAPLALGANIALQCRSSVHCFEMRLLRIEPLIV